MLLRLIFKRCNSALMDNQKIYALTKLNLKKDTVKVRYYQSKHENHILQFPQQRS